MCGKSGKESGHVGGYKRAEVQSRNELSGYLWGAHLPL